jgi:hypothetical protein
MFLMRSFRRLSSAAADSNRYEVNDMNAVKNIFQSIKENYMEYVEMAYGPFER